MIARAQKVMPRIFAHDTLLIDAEGKRVARGIITTVIEDYPPAVLRDGDVFLFLAVDGNRLTYQQARVFRCGRDFS